MAVTVEEVCFEFISSFYFTILNSHNRDKSVPNYSLVPRGERLSSVSTVKDFGITISHDLSWTLYVVEVVSKANKVLGLIKRTIGFANKEIFSTLYKALVRPILEYASPAWCPYLVKNIVLLEKVQRRASRLALGQKHVASKSLINVLSGRVCVNLSFKTEAATV